jgi:membrane protein YdbS with pleckstrin-like domain
MPEEKLVDKLNALIKRAYLLSGIVFLLAIFVLVLALAENNWLVWVCLAVAALCSVSCLFCLHKIKKIRRAYLYR